MSIDLKLTPSELAYANKIITKRERSVRCWPWVRWFSICMGIAFLGLAAFSAYQSYQMLVYDCGSIVDAGDIRSGDLLELSMIRILSQVLIYIKVLMSLIIGSLLLTGTIVLWRRHKRDAIFVKVARAIMATATE